MIVVDISSLALTKKWLNKAKQLTQQLTNMSDDKQRSEFITKHSHMWRDLKAELEKISSNKCWYCEAENIRGDLHVDHYRPKSKVRNKDGTESYGYWWLAFNHTNFRLACSYCNSSHTGPDGDAKGKAAQFPLFRESDRVTSPDSNINDELPFLLDPTNPSDPSLLWFADDGKAISRTPESDGFLYQRAVVSIEILNLNEVKIVEARKKLWNQCHELIERGDRAYAHYKNGSISGKTDFEQVIREIRRLIYSSAQFSAMARACFRGSAYEWVSAVVR